MGIVKEIKERAEEAKKVKNVLIAFPVWQHKELVAASRAAGCSLTAFVRATIDLGLHPKKYRKGA